jgi:hypothetical protein
MNRLKTWYPVLVIVKYYNPRQNGFCCALLMSEEITSYHSLVGNKGITATLHQTQSNLTIAISIMKLLLCTLLFSQGCAAQLNLGNGQSIPSAYVSWFSNGVTTSAGSNAPSTTTSLSHPKSQAKSPSQVVARSDAPSSVPTEAYASDAPSSVPSSEAYASDAPSMIPSKAPSAVLQYAITAGMSDAPSTVPSNAPSTTSDAPSEFKSLKSDAPSTVPSDSPSKVPSRFTSTGLRSSVPTKVSEVPSSSIPPTHLHSLKSLNTTKTPTGSNATNGSPGGLVGTIQGQKSGAYSANFLLSILLAGAISLLV